MILFILLKSKSSAEFHLSHDKMSNKEPFEIIRRELLTTLTLFFSSFRYGDVVPKSPCARLLTFLWMLLGIMFVALLTAIIINSVLDDNDLEIYDKKVCFVKTNN